MKTNARHILLIVLVFLAVFAAYEIYKVFKAGVTDLTTLLKAPFNALAGVWAGITGNVGKLIPSFGPDTSPAGADIAATLQTDSETILGGFQTIWGQDLLSPGKPLPQ